MLRSSEVLKMLKEGKTAREISQITGAKIASVKAHRKRLMDRQLWHDPDSGLQWELDLDQVTDVLIDRFEKAKLVPELMERINRLENQKAALENELRILRQNVDEKLDRERRYKQALQAGDVRPPSGAKK